MYEKLITKLNAIDKDVPITIGLASKTQCNSEKNSYKIKWSYLAPVGGLKSVITKQKF